MVAALKNLFAAGDIKASSDRYLRNAIMQWYPIFAAETGIATQFVASHWGMLLCIAGILGGMFAGVISDRVFQSRRGPVSAVLYAALLVGAGLVYSLLGTGLLGWLMIFMSLCIIGVHGMLLSAVATPMVMVSKRRQR